MNFEELPCLPLSRRLELPDVPAIYFAVSEVDEVLYVGRALSLRARWRGTHHRKAELEEVKDVRIYWLVCEATVLTPMYTTKAPGFLSSTTSFGYPGGGERFLSEVWLTGSKSCSARRPQI